MAKKRPTAKLAKGRDGRWVVNIDLPDGTRITAEKAQNQHIVYSKPERVPRHLKDRIVPPLIQEANRRNLTGYQGDD